jgi:hypothetical protein
LHWGLPEILSEIIPPVSEEIKAEKATVPVARVVGPFEITVLVSIS